MAQPKVVLGHPQAAPQLEQSEPAAMAPAELEAAPENRRAEQDLEAASRARAEAVPTVPAQARIKTWVREMAALARARPEDPARDQVLEMDLD
jgi:hypothetical protein